MTTTNNNIESKNGMSQVIIDMRPKTRMYEGHGRETLTEVYYRVDVTAYTANLYTYTEQAREESKKACEAYYSEVVALLESEGWERQNDKYDDCPTMTKGTQQLRCHPQEIVGNVLGEDVERLAEKLKGMTSCKWIGVDVYSNCVITTSAEDTMQLYRQTWDCEIMDIMAEMFRTKRTTLYYKLEARLHNVADRIRIKINDWRNGKVDYKHDEDVRDFDGVRLGCDYVVNVYLREWARRAISEGRLIVTENADGIKIARWVNKKEEKERAKAIREAEKAKAERQERYNARCKELEAEALAQMPYKVGDTVKSRDGVTGRVVEMHPEVTGDTDSPHLIYEYDGKPTVNVVIVDADGKRHCAHWSFFTLQEASEISDTKTAQDFADALEIREGDRVLSKHFQTMGTVTGIYEWNGGTCYDVTLDKAVRGFSGETIKRTAFRRYGITKNYYPQGTAEIVCNALYYAEELQAGFWGTDSKPRRFQFGNNEIEVFAPTDRRPSWLLVADVFSQPQEMTLQQVAEYLARRYQEANRLPEPPAEVVIDGLSRGQAPDLHSLAHRCYQGASPR